MSFFPCDVLAPRYKRTGLHLVGHLVQFSRVYFMCMPLYPIGLACMHRDDDEEGTCKVIIRGVNPCLPLGMFILFFPLKVGNGE